MAVAGHSHPSRLLASAAARAPLRPLLFTASSASAAAAAAAAGRRPAAAAAAAAAASAFAAARRPFLVRTAATTTPASPQAPRYVYPEGKQSGKSAPSPPRFYAPLSPPHLPSGAATVALPAEEARHALRVLRLRPGDPVELCDGEGRVARGEVAAAQPGKGAGGWAVTVALVLDEGGDRGSGGGGGGDRGSGGAATTTATPSPFVLQPLPPPAGRWELVVAAACLGLKGGRDDWLVEKATELGAAAVLPLATERSPLRPGGAAEWALGGGAGDDGGSSASSGRSAKRRKASAAASTEGGDGSGGSGGGSGGGGGGLMVALGGGGRLARVAAAATKQCLRAHAPRLLAPATVGELAQMLNSGSGAGDRALVATGGAPPVLAQLERLARESGSGGENGGGDSDNGGGGGGGGGGPTASPAASARRPRLYLVVGPEGDFTSAELDALLAGGAALPCGLGPNRLRTETAAVSLLAAAAAAVEAEQADEPK